MADDEAASKKYALFMADDEAASKKHALIMADDKAASKKHALIDIMADDEAASKKLKHAFITMVDDKTEPQPKKKKFKLPAAELDAPWSFDELVSHSSFSMAPSHSSFSMAPSHSSLSMMAPRVRHRRRVSKSRSKDVGVQFNYSVPSRDVGVQFNYLMPMSAHLRGVHVVGEKLFQISGEVPQLLEWEEYGLRIQVPKGATSTPCDIAIKAIVAGQFEFSENTDLVSAVYAISVSKKLTQPVILEMQHCVAISSEEQGRFLSFVRAKCNQPDLPYKFKLLDGGSFPPRSDYGKISCSLFSLVATVCQHPKQLQPADDMFVTMKKYAEPSKEDLPEEHFPEKQEMAKTATLSHNRRISSNNRERFRVEQIPSPSTHLPVETGKQEMAETDTLSNIGHSEVGHIESIIRDSEVKLQPTPLPTETGEAAVHHDGSLPPPLEYRACTFYVNKERNSWVWHFSVTKKLDALIQQVMKVHKLQETPFNFSFQFCEHELLLDLRKYNEKGWTILPKMYPCKLQKQVVDNWTDATPLCRPFEVFAVEGPNTEITLEYYLPVKGIIPLDTELLIHQRLQTTDPVIQHAAPPEHDKASIPDVLLQSPPEIVDFLEQVAVKVSAKWRMLGLKLGVKTHELDEISNQNQDGVLCLERVLASWKDKANPPYTWATVIDALKSPIVGEKSVAEDVEMWLSLKIV